MNSILQASPGYRDAKLSELTCDVLHSVIRLFNVSAEAS